jgi:tetratricopeptide (TPR) repeat protein
MENKNPVILLKVKAVALILWIIIPCILSVEYSSAQSITPQKIAEGVFQLESPINEDQLVITSEKGMVVFNIFWPSMIAQKDEIIRAFKRDDFYLVVNMVDRLDMFCSNAAYSGTTIIGHRAFWNNYKGNQEAVEAEINKLVDMWRWKEEVAREDLAKQEPGSEDEKIKRRWVNTCKQRADQLETEFSLALPTVVYDDRKTIDLGDMTLELIWFGRAGNLNGITIAVIPEAKLAIIPSFILHDAHLAPYPICKYAALDVPRWISIFQELLEGENAVDKIILGFDEIWSRERALPRLKYMRELWNQVERAESEGKNLDEVEDRLSLDNSFAYIKETPLYRERGDDWIRPQHWCHVRLFYLQHKNLASEILRKNPEIPLQDMLARIRAQRDGGDDIYFDEASLNEFGYELMNSSRFADAIEVLKLNVEVFPESANAFDSLAEAYLNIGDKKNAVANYKKSLELNPDNENAKEKLKSL